jgi:Holliday junction resolvasome RuvABC endonuclease subunit
MGIKKEHKGVVLALDTSSSKTGYAIYDRGNIKKSGTWKLKRRICFAELYNVISKTIEKYNVTHIIAEDIFKDKNTQKQSGFQVLAECRGIVECVAQLHNLPVLFITPIRVKQYIWNMRTGQKLTTIQHKEAMIRAITRKGYTLEDDNADDEADAIGLLITYLETGGYHIEHPSQKRHPA